MDLAKAEHTNQPLDGIEDPAQTDARRHSERSGRVLWAPDTSGCNSGPQNGDP